MKNNTLITYEDLRKLEIGQSIDISLLNFKNDDKDNITITKIKSNSYSQNFRVKMKKNSKWNTHFHDCKENIIMYEGKLFDEVNNKQIDRLRPLEIDPFVNHSLLAKEDSVFYIEFKKTKK